MTTLNDPGLPSVTFTDNDVINVNDIESWEVNLTLREGCTAHIVLNNRDNQYNDYGLINFPVQLFCTGDGETYDQWFGGKIAAAAPTYEVRKKWDLTFTAYSYFYLFSKKPINTEKYGTTPGGWPNGINGQDLFNEIVGLYGAMDSSLYDFSGADGIQFTQICISENSISDALKKIAQAATVECYVDNTGKMLARQPITDASSIDYVIPDYNLKKATTTFTNEIGFSRVRVRGRYLNIGENPWGDNSTIYAGNVSWVNNHGGVTNPAIEIMLTGYIPQSIVNAVVTTTDPNVSQITIDSILVSANVINIVLTVKGTLTNAGQQSIPITISAQPVDPTEVDAEGNNSLPLFNYAATRSIASSPQRSVFQMGGAAINYVSLYPPNESGQNRFDIYVQDSTLVQEFGIIWDSVDNKYIPDLDSCKVVGARFIQLFKQGRKKWSLEMEYDKNMMINKKVQFNVPDSNPEGLVIGVVTGLTIRYSAKGPDLSMTAQIEQLTGGVYGLNMFGQTLVGGIVSYYGQAEPLNPGLYLQYGDSSETDQGDGVTTTDSSSYSADGEYVGGVTLQTPGPLVGESSTSATFDGSTGYAQFSNATQSNPPTFTAETLAMPIVVSDTLQNPLKESLGTNSGYNNAGDNVLISSVGGFITEGVNATGTISLLGYSHSFDTFTISDGNLTVTFEFQAVEEDTDPGDVWVPLTSTGYNIQEVNAEALAYQIQNYLNMSASTDGNGNISLTCGYIGVIGNQEIIAGTSNGVSTTGMSGGTDNSYNLTGYEMGVDVNSNLYGTLYNSDAGTRITGSIVNINNWFLADFAYDGSYIYLYQDGILDTSQSVDSYVPNGDSPLRVAAGGTIGNGPAYNFFEGSLSQTVVYPIGFTPDQALTRWQASQGQIPTVVLFSNTDAVTQGNWTQVYGSSWYTFPLIGNNYSNAVLDSSNVLYWPSGTNGRNFVASGDGITTGGQLLPGSNLTSINTIDGFVNNGTIINNPYATVSCIFRVNSLPSGLAPIVGLQNGYGAATKDEDIYLDSEGYLYYYTYVEADESGTTLRSSFPLNIGEAYVIHGTLGSDETCLYINGTLNQSQTPSASGGGFTGYDTPNLFVGGILYDANVLGDFSLSDVAVSSEQLSGTQIAAMATAAFDSPTTLQSGLVQIDEATGQNWWIEGANGPSYTYGSAGYYFVGLSNLPSAVTSVTLGGNVTPTGGTASYFPISPPNTTYAATFISPPSDPFQMFVNVSSPVLLTIPIAAYSGGAYSIWDFTVSRQSDGSILYHDAPWIYNPNGIIYFQFLVVEDVVITLSADIGFGYNPIIVGLLFDQPTGLPTTVEMPSWIECSVINANTISWATQTSNPSVPLQYVGAPTNDRLASAWETQTTDSGDNFTVDINIMDGNSHQIAFYMISYDYAGREQQIVTTDVDNNTVVDTQTISNFEAGIWVNYSLKGHARFEFINQVAGKTAVLSGVFIS